MKTNLLIMSALIATISTFSSFSHAAAVNVDAEGTVLLQGILDGANSASMLLISDETVSQPLYDSLVGSTVKVKVTADAQNRVVATRRNGKNLGCTKIEFFTIGGSKTNYSCSVAFDANGKAGAQK